MPLCKTLDILSKCERKATRWERSILTALTSQGI